MSVAGSFLVHSRNNDSSIAKNIIANNGEDILNRIQDDDIIIVDLGFRDTVDTIKRFGLNVQMPDFLRGKKQLPCNEATHSRCLTKVRWIIEDSEYNETLTTF